MFSSISKIVESILIQPFPGDKIKVQHGQDFVIGTVESSDASMTKVKFKKDKTLNILTHRIKALPKPFRGANFVYTTFNEIHNVANRIATSRAKEYTGNTFSVSDAKQYIKENKGKIVKTPIGKLTVGQPIKGFLSYVFVANIPQSPPSSYNEAALILTRDEVMLYSYSVLADLI